MADDTQVQGVPQGLTEEKLPVANGGVQGVPQGLTEEALPKVSSASEAAHPAGWHPPIDKVETKDQPGFLKRLGQSVGVPTSKEELEAAQPSTAEQVLGPVATVGKIAYNYGKNALKGMQEGGKDVAEAGENIEKGESVLPNLGKAAMGYAHGILQSVPFIGPPMETASEDIVNKDYAGAAGGLTGVVAQLAAPKIAESVEAHGGPAAVTRKLVAAPVRALGDAYNVATQNAPFAVGRVMGNYGTGILAKEVGHILPKAGEGITEFGRTPEEIDFNKREADAKVAEKAAADAKTVLDSYKAGEEKLPGSTPEKVVEKAKETAAEAANLRFHADAAKEKLTTARTAKENTKVVPQDKAITPEDVEQSKLRNLGEQPKQPLGKPMNVKGPGEVAPEEVGAKPVAEPVDRGANVPLAGNKGTLVGKPKALPAYEEPTPENVKGPGEVQPETFPQEPTERPTVPRGDIDLANGQGVRLGERLRLPEKGTAPRQEILPPEKPVGKPTKPERGNVRALTVDEHGNVIDKEQTPEGKLEGLIREGLKPEKTTKLGNAAPTEIKETPKVEPKAIEGKPVEEPKELPKRYEWAKPEEEPKVEPERTERRAVERKAPMSAAELEDAMKNRKPIQTPFDVTEGANETIKKDLEEKGLGNPKAKEGEPKEKEEALQLFKEDSTPKKWLRENKSETDDHAALEASVMDLPKEEFKKAAIKAGIPLHPYDVREILREGGSKHPTGRQQIARQIVQKLTPEAIENFLRNPEETKIAGQDQSNLSKAERAKRQLKNLYE